jgi:beta-lactam-binding protein with PASTA domain
MPDFRNVPREDAEAVLTELGVAPVIIELPNAETAEGLVIAQSPEPGAALDADADVTLVVSTGPE